MWGVLCVWAWLGPIPMVRVAEHESLHVVKAAPFLCGKCGKGRGEAACATHGARDQQCT